MGDWFTYLGDSILVVDRSLLDSLITNTNYDLQKLCISKIDNLDSLFVGNTIRGDITAWDVSNVTSMKGTFAGQANFNQDIRNWDVSAVENMSHLFVAIPFLIEK